MYTKTAKDFCCNDTHILKIAIKIFFNFTILKNKENKQYIASLSIVFYDIKNGQSYLLELYIYRFIRLILYTVFDSKYAWNIGIVNSGLYSSYKHNFRIEIYNLIDMRIVILLGHYFEDELGVLESQNIPNIHMHNVTRDCLHRQT